MNYLEQSLKKQVGDSWQGATEGFKIQAFQSGRKVCDLEFGKTYDFYDWASLTKIVFTVPQVMRAVDEGVALDERISKHLDWKIANLRNVELKQILTHTAGLTWWIPFYKKIPLKGLPSLRWAALEKQLTHHLEAQPRSRSKKAVYSDLDFFVLAFWLRHYFKKDLHPLWNDWADRLDLRQTRFHVMNEPDFKRSRYAPTERCEWRKKVLRGEVHDENTWALGGVSTHSGLFGPIDDLSRYGLWLRKTALGDFDVRRGLPSSKTARLFLKRAIPATRGDWAMGYMMPAKKNSMVGEHISRQAVGHWGFTGTSLWWDPKRDILITILSNRVHPTRDNKKFNLLRPLLHDWILK